MKWMIFIQKQTNKLRHGAWGMAFISNERKYLCMHECTLDAFHPAKVAVFVCSVFFCFSDLIFRKESEKEIPLPLLLLITQTHSHEQEPNRCRLNENKKRTQLKIASQNGRE